MVADKGNIYYLAFQLKDYPVADIYPDLPIIPINLLQAQAFGLLVAGQERQEIIYRRYGLSLGQDIQLFKRTVVGTKIIYNHIYLPLRISRRECALACFMSE